MEMEVSDELQLFLSGVLREAVVRENVDGLETFLMFESAFVLETA